MSDSSVTSVASCTAEADWRVLLPQAPSGVFEHLVLLGGSAGLDTTLLDLGVARRVSRTPRTRDQADAVIVLAGAAESVDTAASYLDPGGVLYWEVERRAPGQLGVTPGRALKRLRRLGLNPTGAYWVKPGFANRQMYLPLGAVGPFRWYLETLYRSPTRLRRILSTAFRALAAHHRGLTAFAPCFAITAVRGIARPPALIERASMEGIPVSDRTMPVLLAHGRHEWNRLVVLLFESDAPVPGVAMKVPRLPSFNGQIEWEHHVLRELGADLGPSMHGSIPTSTLFHWNALAVSAQSCVSGASLHSRAGPAASGTLEDLRLTTAWLAAFHQETTIDRVPAREWIVPRLNGLCSEYAATFGLTAAEAHLFETMERRLPPVGGDTLPIVWQHADFCPPNVYLDRSAVSVIDWETARRGPALADLLSFVTYWGHAVGGCVTDAERLGHFEMLFFGATPGSPFVRAVHEEIAGYMRRLGMSPSLLPHLLVYTFLEKALEEPRRLARLQPSKAVNGAGSLEVGYVGVLAHHADRLSGATRVVASCTGRADVTVAVATIDRPSQLARGVTAVLAGSTLPAELIIIDQSSDMRTADLVAASGWERLVSLTYVRQAHRGLAASRNAAIARASRPIVVFTDDDCMPDPGWLAAIVAGFAGAEQPDAVTGRILPLGPDRPGFHAMSTCTSRCRAVHRGRTRPWTVGSGANTAVSRRWLESIEGFDERLGAGSPGQSAEDVDLLYRLLGAGATVRYEPDAIVFHERQDGPQRLVTSSAYGFGMGAFCAQWARCLHPYTIVMLVGWCLERGRALLAACARRRWWRIPEEMRMLRGLTRGVAYGFTRPRSQALHENLERVPLTFTTRGLTGNTR